MGVRFDYPIPLAREKTFKNKHLSW